MKTLLLTVATALLIVGCSKNPAENVPAAEVKSPSSAPAAADPSAQARTFTLGPTNSAIEFTGSKVTGKHDGGFREFNGELSVVNGKLSPTGNKVVIQTKSLYADSDRLTGHLKSADFFDAEKFPTATFETTNIETGSTNATVTGNLTLHGVTKQISFPAHIDVSHDAVTVTSEFFLNRFDFGMKYPGKVDDLIRQEVVLRLKVKASPKAQG
jgi:polyisoprenoid-binding protein YceI